MASALIAGCATPTYFIGLEEELAFLEDRLMPIESLEGPLYSWGAGERDHTRADVPPQPKGGMEQLMSSVRYPEGARQRCVQGDVMVRFVVSKEGVVIAAAPVEAVDPDLEVAAIATVARTEFEPAVKEGEPVNVVTRIPISFNLRDQRCATRATSPTDADWRYR